MSLVCRNLDDFSVYSGDWVVLETDSSLCRNIEIIFTFYNFENKVLDQVSNV